MKITAGLWRRRAFWDAAFLLLIFFGGARIGSRYIAAYQTKTATEFGQEQFGAAVSLACGRGFASPAVRTSALNDFLLQKVDSISCDQLPKEQSTGQRNFTQNLYRYLMAAVALQWRISGVSWSGMTPLFGVLFGLTLCAAYGLFRLAGGPLLSLVGVVPLAVSAHQLFILPHLRDYAKAPFMLLLLVIMARMAMPPLRPRRTFTLACVFGLVMGVGFGFRNDLLINVPPFLVGVFFLTPGRWRDALPLKAACIATAAIIFVASAWPILAAYGTGSNTGHVAVLGFMSAFDGPLGLTRPGYDLGRHYVDGFAATVIFNHAMVATGRVPDYLSPEYERAAMGLISDLVRNWPADIFIRGCAAALQVLELPFTVGLQSVPLPTGLTAPSLIAFYDTQMSVLRVLSGLGLPLVILAAIILGARAPRAAIAIVLFLLYYCGYPAVQFQTRHLFHLEFIGWWALLFVLAALLHGVRRLAVDRKPSLPDRQTLKGAAMTVAALVGFTVVPLWALRLYQQHHVTAMFDGFLQERRTAMPLSRTPASGGTLINVDGLWADRKPATPIGPRYLVAEFTAEGCGVTDLPVVMKYDVNPLTPVNDFSIVARIAISPDGPTRQLVPAYYNGDFSHFTGFVVPEGCEVCLKSVSRIDDLSRVPVLVNATLTPRWKSNDLFQQVAAFETDKTDPLVKALPPDLMSPDESRAARVTTVRSDDVAPGVTRGADGKVTGRVTANVPELRLAHFPPTEIQKGAVLRVRGVVHRGGLLIGLLKNETWFTLQTVTNPGPFTLLVKASESGPFGVLVADYSAKPWRMEQHSWLRRTALALMPTLVADEFELNDVTWIE